MAEDFTYRITADKTEAYLKEAVVLTVELNQTNPDVVLFFDFDLHPSKNYTFHRIDTKQSDNYQKVKTDYTYLLYPLRSGDLNITFDLTKKVTTKENVAYSFSGDRDNVKGIDTKNIPITLPPFLLHIKALPKAVQLVGDFSLEYKIKKHQANAYEPLPLQIVIKGFGYPPLLENILPKELNVTRFKEKPILHTGNTKKGTQSSVTYPIALSHTQSFDLPAITLNAFNPKTKKAYTLTVPKQHFDIRKIDVNRLVDKTDDPKPLQRDYDWLSTLFGYLVVFGAGYLTALSLRWKKRTMTHKTDPLKEKIEACQDARTLLQLLMATNSRRFASSIEKLEKHLYGNGKMNLKKIKQAILEKL
jgi:hypothetical protein